jgi:PleD family two-component response regulator
MGLATALPPLEGQDPSPLIRIADDNLYRAKQGGRNRYCISLDD